MQIETEKLVESGGHWILDLVDQRNLTAASVWIIFAVVGIFDGLTGYELVFDQFYLIPVFIAGISFGWQSSLLMAIAATAIHLFLGLYQGHMFSNLFYFYLMLTFV